MQIPMVWVWACSVRSSNVLPRLCLLNIEGACLRAYTCHPGEPEMMTIGPPWGCVLRLGRAGGVGWYYHRTSPEYSEYQSTVHPSSPSSPSSDTGDTAAGDWLGAWLAGNGFSRICQTSRVKSNNPGA